jgi:hypothetical protein
MQIHAIATTDTKIEAAISSLPPTTRRLLAAADVSLTGKISVADLDRKLAAAERLSVLDRLAVKVGLEKSGLLGN